MTNEELVYLYQNGDKQALEMIIEQNKGIIYRLSNKFYVEKTNSIDREDLEQEGTLGLITAAQKYKFDIDKPCKFITYAVYWIYQKISRFINTRCANDETSLNTHVGDDRDTELMDFVESVDYSFENVEEKLYQQQLRKELDQVMYENLTLQEREVLKLRYGWNSKCMTLDEIGNLLSITRGRVRQIESKSLRKLRNSSWGRIKAKEYYSEKFSNKNCKIDNKIKALDFELKYLNSNSFDNYLDKVMEGIE